MSVDVGMIVREAERSGSAIEFLPQVGDFVASVFSFGIYGGGRICARRRSSMR